MSCPLLSSSLLREIPAVNGAFVFDTSGDLHVFASADHAAGWLEAVDVDLGEYAAASPSTGRCSSSAPPGRPSSSDGPTAWTSPH